MPGRRREARIAEAVARIASGIGGAELETLPNTMVEAIKLTASRLVRDKSGVLYCRLCGRGPFTPKGMYLHLTRIHQSELVEIVNSEFERLSSASKRLKA